MRLSKERKTFMEHDYGKEISELRESFADLKKLLDELISNERSKRSDAVADAPHKRGSIEAMKNMHPDPRLGSIMEELCSLADSDGETGRITYLGVYASGGRQSNWICNQLSTNTLLPLIESGAAAKVLSCIGNSNRLNMLLAILKKPSSVAQLTETLGFGSSGQVYHHLGPLLSADLVKEDEQKRGQYVVVPYRVQGIIMILAGINDLLDPQYSFGNWETQ
jgi:DNA-binding transcriptional ArsR family regulator